MKKKKYLVEKDDLYVNMVVIQPTVVNISESVFLEEMFMENDIYDSEQGVIVQKIDDVDFDNSNMGGK
jgi:hypothetical protein